MHTIITPLAGHTVILIQQQKHTNHVHYNVNTKHINQHLNPFF